MKLNSTQKRQLRSLIKTAHKLAGKIDQPHDSRLDTWDASAEKIVKPIFGDSVFSQLRNQAPNHGLFAIPPDASYWIRYYKYTLDQKAYFLESLINSSDTENIGPFTNRWPFHKKIEKICIPIFDDGHYPEAVEKGFKVVRERLRKLTGHETGSEAFGKGKLHIHGATDSGDFDFNEAAKFLCMAIDFFRNEKAHNAYAKLSEPQKALEYLALSSLAMRLLDNAGTKR
jgi:uncharacterized protein (TIGR02391 family)